MPIKTYLTSDEIQRMIDTAPCLRDKLILTFYADSGCRVSELLNIRVENIDPDTGAVMIPHLKRGVHKKCPGCGHSGGASTRFCSKCGTDLKNVTPFGIEERKRLINVGDATMALLKKFILEAHPQDKLINLTRQQVYNVIRGSAARIGIEGKAMLNPNTGKKHFVHPHSFRDSLAVEWLDMSGGDIGKQKALQEQLGHQNFDTTMRYYKLKPSTVRKVGDEVRAKRFGAVKESGQ